MRCPYNSLALACIMVRVILTRQTVQPRSMEKNGDMLMLSAVLVSMDLERLELWDGLDATEKQLVAVLDLRTGPLNSADYVGIPLLDAGRGTYYRDSLQGLIAVPKTLVLDVLGRRKAKQRILLAW